MNDTAFPIVKERQLYFFAPSDFTCNASAYKVLSLNDWHRALGHLNFDDILQLEKVCEGMKITNKTKRYCETCALNKQTHSPIQHGQISTANKPLQHVSSDVCGPISPPTKEGYRYVINFVDSYSGMGYVYFLKTKDVAYKALEQFLADVAPYGKVQSFHSDNGTEFLSYNFKEILRKNGIKQTTTAPYSAHQNGRAERQWRTLLEATRCMLHESNLPKSLWAYGVRYAQYVRNRRFH